MDNLNSMYLSSVGIPMYIVSKNDMIGIKSSTDGYQPKFIKNDLFLKANAIINGVSMNDHIVEKIASDICEDLRISAVKQSLCKIQFGNQIMNGVSSKNFSLDGTTFISFKSFLDFKCKSYIEEELIKGSAIDKMKLCAKVVSDNSNISYSDYLRYLIDIALLDSIVGNTDRHLKNFGLFKSSRGVLEVPLIFDNGMGMFENTHYRDSFKSLKDADRYLYVSPYGEDPFDMIDILFDNFDMYHYNFNNIRIPPLFPNELGKEYFHKIYEYILRRL